MRQCGEYCFRTETVRALRLWKICREWQSLRAWLKRRASPAQRVAFGRLHIASALPDFLGRYPEVKIDMATTDRFVDLAEEGYDVAVRIADQPTPTLVARKLAPVN